MNKTKIDHRFSEKLSKNFLTPKTITSNFEMFYMSTVSFEEDIRIIR